MNMHNGHVPNDTTALRGDAAIIKYSSDAIIEVTLDSIIASWNPAAEKLYGYAAEEAVGKPITLIFPPDRIVEENHILLRIAAGEEVQHYETARVRKDGKRVEISLTVSPVKDASGKTVSSSRIARDITERKRQEEQLHTQAAALEAAANAIMITGRDGVITWVNSAFTVLTGYAPREVIGRKPNLLKSEFQDSTFYKRLWETILSGEVWRGEMVNKRKDGSLYTEEETITPLHGVEGEITHFIAIKQDITQRKRSEEALAAANARYKSTLDHMIEGCQIIGPDWRYIYLNDVAALHARRPKEELIGRTMTELYPGIENTEMFGRVRDCVENKVSHRMENRFVYPDGTNAWFDISIEPVAEGAFVLSIDVTEQKRNFEELQKHRGQLEELVKERTVQLEEANRELEAFSYSVSHDLRAPLRHIDGFVDLLKRGTDGKLDASSARYLEVISSSARTMGTLIDELLVFSRMGRSEIRTASIPTAEMVREVMKSLEEDVKGRRIRWELGPLPQVEADPAMLRLVFVNLLSNAIKYTGREADAEISIDSKEAEGERVFCVKDNGVGFDMKYADKLFGVFQRLHRQEDFEGVGIGLANVRRIVRRHGGRTWAEGKLNEGAAFYFTLPDKNERKTHE